MTATAEARRDLYRERILAAAETEFGRLGFAATKVTAIAATADVSLATVYKSFDGKSGIWDALHSERMESLLAEISHLPDLGSSLDRMLGGVGAVCRFLMRHDAYLDLSLGAGGGWLAPSTGEGVQGTVWDAGIDMIVSGLESVAAAGQLTDIRPRIAGGMVVSALQVWLADWVASGRDRSPDVLVDDLLRHLRALLETPGGRA
ncbi:TetR/AcrR family transcriptional regulator [Nocardioides acrostichi]|uniref:TetR/AcrR family transcriptional regulator n=1 Tax=Nocardioides acrostichi TaxID=2784339 RepID=A0A930UYZ7_9ACTN|nr:TetR/AcrR family transcriptional regulator [Nocardioides acrostichi]MBF4160846.1 TetR/AcrR family transcriptional regulator [Nocardioides acrostichi]